MGDVLDAGQDRAVLLGLVTDGDEPVERLTPELLDRLAPVGRQVEPDLGHDRDVSGRIRGTSVPALNASNVSGAQELTMASAIWDRALLWVQTNRMRFLAMAE